MSERRLIGRTATLASREAIYELADGLEIQSSSHYEVDRRRVLFEDVVLVTHHHEKGTLFLVLTALFALFFLSFGAFFYSVAPNDVTILVFGLIALPFVVMFLVRLIVGVEVITVFGRRSRAAVRFTFRKRRARELYGNLCARVRAVQRAATPEPEPQPVAGEMPLPPPLTES